MVILEAMPAGVPVVATNILGTRELISHGENGWLAPVGEHSIMAKLVLDLLDDKSQASAFVEKSTERIEEEFTQENMFRAIQKLYFSLLAPEEDERQ